MAQREKANPKIDRKIFSATADKIHSKNLVMPHRGGYRL